MVHRPRQSPDIRVPYTQEQIDKLIRDKNKRRYQCWWCGRIFEEPNAKRKLNSHLGSCEKRIWKKLYDIGEYRFTVYLNPWRRLMKAINVLKEQLQGGPRAEERFFSILLAYKTLGYVRHYLVEKLPKTEEAGSLNIASDMNALKNLGDKVKPITQEEADAIPKTEGYEGAEEVSADNIPI